MPSSESWETLRARLAREQAILVALAVAYFVAGRIGLALSFGHPATSLVWPSAGIALGAVLVLGHRVWPAVCAAATLLYASVLGPAPAALLLGVGNALEAVLAAYLINRYAGGRHAFGTPRNSLRFAGYVLLVSAAVSANFNTLVLIVAGAATWSDYGVLWVVLCLGSFVGMQLVAPPIVLYSLPGPGPGPGPRPDPDRKLLAERILAGAAGAAIGLIVFSRLPLELRALPGELLCMPLLIWVAVRLGRRAATLALLTLSVVAVFATLNMYGPFVRATPLGSLMTVQLFIAMNAIITISLAALASEHTVAAAQLREVVITDPLTGLPNYRRLLEVLTHEISRTDRSQRQFAVVFFDMDGLKSINDEHGHLVGSRAVCRFAETLGAACRATDTAARYGGDEFVAVLAETDDEGARLVVRRIMEQLNEDGDNPPLAVSAGIAVYPRDGSTPTTLLSAADRALYAAKAEKSRVRPTNVVGIREWTNTGSA